MSSSASAASASHLSSLLLRKCLLSYIHMTPPERKWLMVRDIMIDFAERTGLSPEVLSPERYLWTDSFAVCNFLGLYRKTGDEQYRRLALLLVDQVHAVLGRHRKDDERFGWISGLDEEEGRRHPTIGGLRIGKELKERRPAEPLDEHLEWDRDGQYFHYLTQWMHALDCVSFATGDSTVNRWALELAKAANAGFTYAPQEGKRKRLYWKMSIDLSYPLVSSMGHHDPLEGLITYSELQATSGRLSRKLPPEKLGEEISDMVTICEGKDWSTDDPLGIGGLLAGAYRMAELIVAGSFPHRDLFQGVLEDSLRSLGSFGGQSLLNLPAYHRLAFREFGLSIGLQATQRLQDLAGRYPEVFGKFSGLIQKLARYAGLSEEINAFWLKDKNRESATWAEHFNINMVMLATSLDPDGYFSISHLPTA